MHDTEAELQLFVEEWRALDVSGANRLSLKELAILLQRLPVPMGVGDAGGADELGELMTQLLVCQPSPFRTMTLLLTTPPGGCVG